MKKKLFRKLRPFDHPIMIAACKTSGIIGRIHSDKGLKVMKDLPEEDTRKLYFELKDLHQRVADLLGEDRDWIKDYMLNAHYVNKDDILLAYENRSTILETSCEIKRLDEALE